jgi:hypothetical protein
VVGEALLVGVRRARCMQTSVSDDAGARHAHARGYEATCTRDRGRLGMRDDGLLALAVGEDSARALNYIRGSALLPQRSRDALDGSQSSELRRSLPLMLLTALGIVAPKIQSSMTWGDIIVGAGTLLLAAFTCWLGFETRASARAAQEAVEASEEPFVIATPTDDLANMKLRMDEDPSEEGVPPPLEIHRAKDSNGHFVRLKLWNIGSGPAIVEDVGLYRGSERFVDGLPHFQPVGAGVAADIEIGSSAWPMSSRAATLIVEYTRASGLAYRTSSEVVIDGPLVLVKTYRREAR